MKYDKTDMIQEAARIFATRNRAVLAVLAGRWWRLGTDCRWTPHAARPYAEHAIGELAAFVPDDPWLQRHLHTAWGRNRILAEAGWLLRCEGLPGPGFVADLDQEHQD